MSCLIVSTSSSCASTKASTTLSGTVQKLHQSCVLSKPLSSMSALPCAASTTARTALPSESSQPSRIEAAFLLDARCSALAPAFRWLRARTKPRQNVSSLSPARAQCSRKPLCAPSNPRLTARPRNCSMPSAASPNRKTKVPVLPSSPASCSWSLSQIRWKPPASASSTPVASPSSPPSYASAKYLRNLSAAPSAAVKRPAMSSMRAKSVSVMLPS
mmetsp:Transcript_71299/g.195385  ORF Transcript_71299/g.195385 Transcript_71299/m.195385 type:complete len:216 (-) Transcript_71299:32-679(-)